MQQILHLLGRISFIKRYDDNLLTQTYRLIGPLFADGMSAPRISVTGNQLPLSRIVSRTMHPDEGFHDHAGTVMVIAWGQFMDHDFTLTGTPLGNNIHLPRNLIYLNKMQFRSSQS